VEKSVGKVLTSIFWDQDGIFLIDYLSKETNYQRGVLLISAGAIEGHFEGKTLLEGHQGVLFLHSNAPAHQALATQKKLAYLGFQCLDHPPYSLDLAPSDYHLFPGLKKTIERSPFFVRHRGHCCCGDLVGCGQPSEFFLSGLQKLEQQAKKCTELHGEYDEQIPSLVAVAGFLPGWAKDLSAPLIKY